MVSWTRGGAQEAAAWTRACPGGNQAVYEASIRLLATRSAVAGAIRIPLR